MISNWLFFVDVPLIEVRYVVSEDVTPAEYTRLG